MELPFIDILRSWVHWIAPETCVHCKKIGNWWCEECKKSITYELIKSSPRWYPTWAGDVIGMYSFSQRGVREAIHRFKFLNQPRWAERLTFPFIPSILKLFNQLHPSSLVPVPLHSSRKRSRGYNQAELIAIELQKITGIPLCYAHRHVRTQQQALISSDLKRHFNVFNSISLTEHPGARALLIDDVCTTGATLGALAHAFPVNCHPCGALVLALAPPHTKFL